jgi:uncharacterized protein
MDVDGVIAAMKAEFPGPVREIGERRVEMVAMRDGVGLATRVFLPKGKGPWPAVLIRNPYAGPMTAMMSAAADVLNGSGYAVALQDCRGTGDSEGEWEPFANERADGLDAIEWLRHEAWQDGNIGMFGASYLSFAQWLVADSLPPEVKTLFIMVAGTERHRQMYMNGMFRHEIYTSWAVENAGAGQDIDQGRAYQEAIRMRPHIGMDEALIGKRLQWYRDWVSQVGSDEPLWTSGLWRELQLIPAKIEAPICMVAGWFDHHLDGMSCAYANLSAEAKAKSRFVIGPWTHDLQTRGDLRFPGSQILGTMGLRSAVEWFDHFLKGLPLKGPLGTVEAYEIGSDSWKSYRSWPPVSDPARFFLRIDAGGAKAGALSPEPPTETASVSYDYDPADPVPTLGGSGVLAWMNPRLRGATPASVRQSEIGYRPDVLSFLSDPFSRSVAIVGRIRVRLYVASDAEDTAFTVKVMELRPDGAAYNIADGVATLAYRAGIGAPVAYERDAIVGLDIELWPTDWRIAALSRLRLDVSSSNFPAYHAHPNRSGPWAEALSAVVARETLHSGGACASFLELPSIRGDSISLS